MEVLDGARIRYDERRIMDCRALTNFDDKLPFNFLDYYDEHRARELALGCSRFVTQTIMEWRHEEAEHQLPFPEANSVYDFVTGLGIEPYGKLSLVETAEGPRGHNSGLTTYGNLRSIVMKDVNFLHYNSNSSELTEGDMYNFNMMRASHVAAHELAHLAGAEDRAYFIVDPNEPTHAIDIQIAGTSLTDHPYRTRGEYFEEGFSSLIGSLYSVNDNTVMQSLEETEPFQSPSGTRLHIPQRFNIVGHHMGVFSGWGIERLISLIPDVWDILLASRTYAATAATIRPQLQQCIEAVDPWLFQHIDNVDPYDIDESMEVTDRIVYAARRS
jgi:hypothetical protein